MANQKREIESRDHPPVQMPVQARVATILCIVAIMLPSASSFSVLQNVALRSGLGSKSWIGTQPFTRPNRCLAGARRMCEKENFQDKIKQLEGEMGLKKGEEVDEFKEIREIQNRLWLAAETGELNAQEGPPHSHSTVMSQTNSGTFNSWSQAIWRECVLRSRTVPWSTPNSTTRCWRGQVLEEKAWMQVCLDRALSTWPLCLAGLKLCKNFSRCSLQNETFFSLCSPILFCVDDIF